MGRENECNGLLHAALRWPKLKEEEEFNNYGCIIFLFL